MKNIVVLFSSLIVLFTCSFSVFAINNTFPQDGFTNAYSYTVDNVAPSISTGAGIDVFLPRLTENVPFSYQYIGGTGLDVGLSAGVGPAGVSINFPTAMGDTYYTYTGSMSHSFPIRIRFDPVLCNVPLNGYLYIPLLFASDSTPYFSAYESSGVAYNFSTRQVVDFTKRFDLSLLTDSTDSLQVSLSRTSTNNRYGLNINFNDFVCCSSSSTTTSASEICITLQYDFNFVLALAGDSFNNNSQNPLTPLTAFIVDAYPNGFTANQYMQNTLCNLHLGTFMYSNDYYAVLNAIENAIGSDQTAIHNIIWQINYLLEEFLDVSGQRIPIDFPTFSNQILAALGTITSNTSDDYSSELSQIISLLGAVNSKFGTLNTWCTSLYTLVTHSNDSLEELCGYGASIEANSEWLLEIYNMISGLIVYPINPDSEVPGRDDYLELYSQPLIGLLYALACGFTGEYLGEGDLFPDSLSHNTYERWVDIISDALIRVYDGYVPSGSDDLSEDIQLINQYEEVYHDYEESLWTRVRTILIDNDLFDRYSTAPSSVVSAGDWFVTSINYVFGSLGIFTFVISTVLLSGVFVVVLGRIRQFT